jgi:hypothetical protein
MTRKAFLVWGLIVAAAAVVLLLVVVLKPRGELAGERRVEVGATPVARLDRFASHRGAELAPQLRFTGGLTLRSSEPAFGGLSALHISADRTWLLAVTDTGHWVRARPSWRDELMTGLDEVTMAPIRAAGGRSLRASGHGDVEALAIADAGAYVADESHGSTVFFVPRVPAALDAAAVHLAPRATMRTVRRNRGIEALALIPGNGGSPRLLAIAERNADPAADHAPAWLIPLAAREAPMRVLKYSPSPGFDVSDATYSEACGLLVLERRFGLPHLFAIRLKSVALDRIDAGGTLTGRTLLAAGSLTTVIDNMEGVSAVDRPDRSCDVFLISDDNFSPLQSTRILQFRLSPADA